jgi:hypothetical protein
MLGVFKQARSILAVAPARDIVDLIERHRRS